MKAQAEWEDVGNSARDQEQETKKPRAKKPRIIVKNQESRLKNKF